MTMRFAALLALTCAGALGGCASSPAAPDAPAKVNIAFSYRPDANGGAPLKIRLFMLRASSDFASADFYSLQNRASSLLGENLLDSNVFFLTRQTPRSVTASVPPVGTRYVGIMAEYQTIDRKVWRKVLTLPAARPRPFYRVWQSDENVLKVSIVAGKEGLTLSQSSND